MKLRIKLPMSATQTRWLLRGSRYFFFITGILALAYVGLTLLDARLYQASAKRSLENQIAENRIVANQIRPATEHEIVQPEPAVRPAVKDGDLLGRIDIPRLGVSVAVLQGTNSRMLRLGAGHIEDTPLPGEPGNIGIAGHRDTFFRELKDIRPKDEIQLQTATGLFRYEVDWARVVTPDDVSVLAPSTDSVLTLVTCYPFYFVGPAPRRFVVRAHRD
jgi:sortase A